MVSSPDYFETTLLSFLLRTNTLTCTDTDPNLKVLQLGCFRYFQRGGNCIDGPVGLLAGIIRQPLILFYHFFSVALYAIWIRVAEAPLLLKPWALVSSVAVFWTACKVIFPYIWCELKP